MRIPSFPRSPYAGFFLFAALLAVMPQFLTNDYHLNVLIFIGIHCIIAIGLDLLLGYTGQISLGHAAFFGLGAYITGVLSAKASLPPIAGLAVALVGVGILAYFIGIPTLKLHGHYLAMATLGFGIIIQIFFNELDFLTGGPSGLVGIEDMSIFGYEFDSDLKYYYLVCVSLLLTLLLSINVVKSRVGRALRAIHGSEVASSVIGVNVSRYKVAIFVLSALYAAFAGWLYSHYMTFVSPSSFGFMFSVKLITMVVIGSLGSIWGAIFGAALITSMPEFLHVFQNYETTVFGFILIIVMIFMPRGLLRGLEDLLLSLWHAVRKRIIGTREETP
ncbi:MAG: branched-chain amino acid ABC transporter permease [bacterium]|nr:branched-chain amino acid ABC transporter permease [bacterium]MDT8366587.1 branched-chain amino acid ABC transporter permease [bacterium]